MLQIYGYVCATKYLRYCCSYTNIFFFGKLKQDNHIQLNDTLIELKQRKTSGLDVIEELSENDVFFDDITYEITDHVTTNKGEILFQVDGCWIDYKNSTEKCGKDVMKKYLRENNLNNVYGKVSTTTSKKIHEELQKDKMKKKRNEIRSTLNKRKRRNDATPKNSGSRTKLVIKDHELTAAGTFYTVCNDNGETETINHRILIETHPSQVKKYQKYVENKRKQLRPRGKQIRGKQIRGKQLQRNDQPNQKKNSIEAGIKKSGESIASKHSIDADDKTSETSNKKEHSMEADDKTSETSNEKEQSMEADDKTPGQSNEKEHSSEEDDQDLAVSQILSHRKKNGEINYLLQFTDGTKDYAAEKEAKIDCPQILKEYKKKHGLEGDGAKRNTRKKTVTESKRIRKTYVCTVDHELLESYVDESNAKYFSVGQRFWNVKCRKCKVLIVGDENNDDVEKIKKFRPTIKKPAYICLNRTHGCMHAMCFNCTKKLMVNVTGTTRASRHRK